MPLAMAAGADRSERSGSGLALSELALKRWTRKRHHGHLHMKPRLPVARKKAQQKPEAVAGACRLATPVAFPHPINSVASLPHVSVTVGPLQPISTPTI